MSLLTIIGNVLHRLQAYIEHKHLLTWAELYAELYAEDADLQELTESALAGWPE